ncbi:BTAD domain-containing putative transcriptional regulator [Streptomyces sp. JJ36]|uniref:AfsR/SARP family transcriptional regulator n=1 Tax=Streptomyces sp. JJ36 TaxID=2736645 RepID=UPI001F00576C|nr:BTAD domain-containing putative transcriptional regulator [Streptomyces sp. JJ36]MCF6521804.1 AfsR/SARP family transcriptional regulator [Streptomyces sp. JJ36]
MLIDILGPLRIRHGDVSVDVPGEKLRAIIATLALSPGEVVSGAKLLDELWGENPPRTAANTLQGHIARLRRTLVQQTRSPYAREAIRTSSSGYILDVDAENIDALRFTQIVEHVGVRVRTDPERSIEQLTGALRMWRGAALSDAGQGIACRTACAHLEEMKLIARELLIEAKSALGLHREVVPELEQLLTRYPLRERFCEQLMLALYRSGRQADAISAYHRVRRQLSDDLGLEPGPGMQARLSEILRQEPSLLA